MLIIVTTENFYITIMNLGYISYIIEQMSIYMYEVISLGGFWSFMLKGKINNKIFKLRNYISLLGTNKQEQ